MRRHHGEKFYRNCVVPTVIHPTKVMIWSDLSGKGTGHLYVVKGIMRQLREWGTIHFHTRWSSLPHCTVYESFFVRKKYLSVGPGNSPVMNPIENVCELMKTELAIDVIINKPRLLEKIINVWNHHPQMQETVQWYTFRLVLRVSTILSKFSVG